MNLRPWICVVLGQALAASIGVSVLYHRFSMSVPPKVPPYPSYQASRALPRNHRLETEDLTSASSLSKGDLALLPKKTEFIGRYLTAKKQKDDPLLPGDTGIRPFLDATPEMAYYFLDLSNQTVPVELLDAGTKVELSYCANPSEAKKECTPTTRSAEVGAVLCDPSQPRKCLAAIKMTRVMEEELGHSPASEPIRLFILGD